MKSPTVIDTPAAAKMLELSRMAYFEHRRNAQNFPPSVPGYRRGTYHACDMHAYAARYFSGLADKAEAEAAALRARARHFAELAQEA